MRYNLFLDDERFPSKFVALTQQCVIARSYEDALYYLVNWGCPDFISFDHDLGVDKDGYDFAKTFCDLVQKQRIVLPDNFNFAVHSMNPVGAENIQKYMENFMDKMGYFKL